MLKLSLLTFFVIIDAGRVAEQIEHLKVLFIIAIFAFDIAVNFTVNMLGIILFLFRRLIDLLIFRLFRRSFNIVIDHLFH